MYNLRKFFSKHNLLIHDFFWRSLQVVGKQGVNFFIFILCAKYLSAYDFGIYNFVLVIIYFLVMFGDFGISTATSKYVAEYHHNDREKLKSVLFNSGLLIILITAVVSLVTLLLGPSQFGDKYQYVLLALPMLFFSPMTSLFDGIYRGLKQFKKLALISLIVGGISMLIVYLLVQFHGLKGALLAQNIFYGSLFLGLLFCYRDFNFKINKRIIKEIGIYSLYVGIADLGIFLYIQFDILVLGHFNYINEISYLSIANKVFMILALPYGIFSQIISPDITKLFIEGKKFLILTKLKKYFLYSMATGIMLALATFFLAKPIVYSFFPQYNNQFFFMYFGLLLTIFPIRSFGSILATSFIVSTGRAKIMMINNFVFGLLNVGMDLIFIILFGPIGVVFSTLLLGHVSIFVAYYFYQKSIKL